MAKTATCLALTLCLWYSVLRWSQMKRPCFVVGYIKFEIQSILPKLWCLLWNQQWLTSSQEWKKRTRPVQFRTKQCFKLRKYWDLLWSLMSVVDKVSFNSSFLVFYWNLFFFVFVGLKKNVYSVCLNHMNNLDLELRIKTCAFETH